MSIEPLMEKQIFPGTVDALEPIRKYVAAAAQSAGLDRKAIYRLCLAVDEIATNIVLHGYQEAGLEGDLKIGTSLEGGSLVVLLEDHGRPYDPNFHSVPEAEDLDLPLESKQIGGLGIYLALDGVDDLQYLATDGANVHRFVVRLPHSPESKT
jgi:anti-sigma regulatory factor (Ser/Thr protein kinase)